MGRHGEEVAARFLVERGFSIIARNWRPSLQAASTCGADEDSASTYLKLRGELDAVAWDGAPFDGGVLCFVEVKARASSQWGTPGQAVGIAKQRQIVRLAQAFLSLHAIREPRLWDASCRFDVIEVWAPPGQEPRITLHRAAFDAS
jgi:putative endonuclease